MKKGKRIMAIAAGPWDEVPTYEPQNPHYKLNGYFPKESYSDQGTAEIEESMADNFTKAKPSRVAFGQDDDGYARELYTLQDEQLA
jgi:hypothetical protein